MTSKQSAHKIRRQAIRNICRMALEALPGYALYIAWVVWMTTSILEEL